MSVPVVDPLEIVEVGSSPAAPSAGRILVYAKTDDKVYKQTSGGVETELGAGGGGAVSRTFSFFIA